MIFPVYACTVAYTGQVTFNKVLEIRPCLTGQVLVTYFGCVLPAVEPVVAEEKDVELEVGPLLLVLDVGQPTLHSL